jgi:multidrug efflux pump
MRSQAFEGGGFVLVEFEAGFDANRALADVRAKTDKRRRTCRATPTSRW